MFNFLQNITSEDFHVKRLGECSVRSPINDFFEGEQGEQRFIDDEHDKVVFTPLVSHLRKWLDEGKEVPMLDMAGPRRNIFFDPARTKCAIVTCGGLCPGLNDVVRGLVMTAYHRYGIKTIYGVPYGYEGFIDKFNHTPMVLTPPNISHIHTLGGSILGSSRGEQPSDEIVDWLVKNEVNILFVIGGDGTLRGGRDIYAEVEKRGLPISVVGVPKTIDNDVIFMDKSFGFETAFTEAVKSIDCAHVEATGAPRGIGLVKLMGRHSGFIAAYATLGRSDVNFVLIPEEDFDLHGDHGFLKALERRMDSRGHAVVVVAEGAGQSLMDAEDLGTDASGNTRLKDIGVFLKNQISAYFKNIGKPVSLKYIDPSYTIRSIPANARDSVFCNRLAQCAVHAAMSGNTAMVVGRWNMSFVHLPISLVTRARKQVDSDGDLWMSVVESTGQPISMKNH